MPRESHPAPAMRAGAVVLAAGQSARMGAAKTLLDFGGLPLVRHAALQVLQAGYDPVIVVVSHPAEAIGQALSGLPLRVVINHRAHEGIGTSIAAGIDALDDEAERAAVVLADQPLVRADYLAQLRRRAAEYAVVASRYDGTVGVPALFSRATFARLRALAPDEGCKGVIRELSDQALFLDCADAAVDIDTREDYERVRARMLR